MKKDINLKEGKEQYMGRRKGKGNMMQSYYNLKKLNK